MIKTASPHEKKAPNRIIGAADYDLSDCFPCPYLIKTGPRFLSVWDGFVRTQLPRFFHDDQQKQRRSKALKADTFLAIKLSGAIPNHTYEDLKKKVSSSIEKNIGLQAFFRK